MAVEQLKGPVESLIRPISLSLCYQRVGQVDHGRQVLRVILHASGVLHPFEQGHGVIDALPVAGS
jgi:hypothetical protein